MFYSHEVLTNRKYGVATIWLVATLGAKSTAKKVTRKAILNVNLDKACETIMEPDAPMALRLQGSLLYGVTRVYSQKWDYLLHDTQIIHTSMRAFLRTAASNQNDMDASMTKPEQLLLQDDPAFLIGDIQPPPLEPDLGTQGDSQRSSQSMLTIRGRSGSVISNRSGSAFGINLPSSSNGDAGSYQLPNNDNFRGLVQHGFGEPDIFNEEEQMIIDDDGLFDFDPNGNLIDVPAGAREARHGGSVIPKSHIGSDSAASGRVRKEHEEALAGRALPDFDGDGDFNMINFDDGMGILPDAEPFPAAAQFPSNRPHLNDKDLQEFEESSSISAEAPAKRKKSKAKKKMAMDEKTQLSNSILNENSTNYLKNMAIQRLAKIQHKAVVQAKKNAFYWVFGSGLNGVGNGVGVSQLPHPLAAFSGEALFAKLAGETGATPLKLKKGTKRGHSEAATASDVEELTPSKRARESELGRGNTYEDEGMMLNLDDDQQYLDPNVSQSVEIGRDAASALQDYPSSAHMPWNISASAHSHQRGQSSSAKGLIGLGSRRLTSASPLVGRGSALPGDLERFSQNMDEGMVMYGRSDNDDFDAGDVGISTSHPNAAEPTSQSHSQHEDFEIFGAAAGVDTQTAGTSQWVRDALDKESNNFFEFVKNTIMEKQDDELSAQDEDECDKSVTFEELFDPEKNSAVVAAQAFYHVLSLVTKRRIWVDQYGGEDEIGGLIRIGIMEMIAV